MNVELETALKIYGEDFHKLLYWHLCFGVVVSDAEYKLRRSNKLNNGSLKRN